MEASPWTEVEIELHAERPHDRPYEEVEAWIDFEHDAGTRLRRPAFWDGGGRWLVRFASPLPEGSWAWTSDASVDDPGLRGREGRVGVAACATGPPGTSGEAFLRRGFWRMSPGGRNLVHADGTACLLVADTAWALPWRATVEDCEEYAAFRAAQGFNAALLMTVQPDLHSRGPDDRTADGGFGVGFDDLSEGRLTRLNPAYFQHLDRLVAVLLERGIVPVHQPVFHGYGWKGGGTAGRVVPPAEYARFCRYLVARYGARPAVWLVCGDGHGREAGVEEAGREVEAHDAYGQPTGLHYQPHGENDAWQDRPWLDFQWCQTGHSGEHAPERVATMWRNTPPKGVANGEPTYERMGAPDRATGWWQGHEAWCNLCAGGTMGVVYGAASLWQWRLHPAEPGFADWTLAEGAGWREALRFGGAGHVGVIRRVFEGLGFADMEPNRTWTHGRRALAVPGRFFLVYLAHGGYVKLLDERIPPRYRVLDARDGSELTTGHVGPGADEIRAPEGVPCVVVCTPQA